MTASDLLADGSTILRVLAPGRGMPDLAGRPRAGLALAVATAASLAAAAAVLPRLDYGPGLSPPAAQGRDAPREPTEHEREEAARRVRKVGLVARGASAAFLPWVSAMVAAGLLVAAFRVAGVRPGYRAALSVAAHGMLPIWLGGVLQIPAAIARAPVPVEQLRLLLPASPAALLPPEAAPALVALLSGFDFFTLWAAALVALGMAQVSGASCARSAVTTLTLLLAYVALFRVIPAGR
jgi:hypothetical protein